MGKNISEKRERKAISSFLDDIKPVGMNIKKERGTENWGRKSRFWGWGRISSCMELYTPLCMINLPDGIPASHYIGMATKRLDIRFKLTGT